LWFLDIYLTVVETSKVYIPMPTQNDIPVAQRLTDTKRSPQKQSVSANSSTNTSSNNVVVRSLQSVPWWAYGLAVLAFLSPIVLSTIVSSVWSALNANSQNASTAATEGSTTTEATQPASASAIPNVAPFINSSPSAVSNNANDNPAANTEIIAKESNVPPDLFGHHVYSEAPSNQLRAIGRAADGYEIRLREVAAKNYLSMEAAAKADGVDLVVISGFRTIAEQQQLFFDISKQRNQTPAQRAKVSAPPGHSEHHTGYAIDIGDANVASANLSTSFEKTAAFQWLQNNAAKYGFELSFPMNNSQGVMYEPWHWRFVGDDDSLRTFYKKQNRSSSFIKKP
jgi:D-alanyl-D-alanine carboxypeptidase